MAYYRKSVPVGWVDEEGKLYPLTTAPGVILNTPLTPCFAAVGEWIDDGFHCRFCDVYIGYGSSHEIDGKTACSSCQPCPGCELGAVSIYSSWSTCERCRREAPLDEPELV